MKKNIKVFGAYIHPGTASFSHSFSSQTFSAKLVRDIWLENWRKDGFKKKNLTITILAYSNLNIANWPFVTLFEIVVISKFQNTDRKITRIKDMVCAIFR